MTKFRPYFGAFVLFAALILGRAAVALTNNLALTPPMGWNDWNSYGCGISESIVSNNAYIINTSGLQAAGYQYVDVDDCWQISRDTNGVIVPDPSKFPHGMASLANYVHSLGLKFGVYSDHGTNTCQHKPGSYLYEYVDANTYAQWGADYLKEDNCNLPVGANAQVDYGRMSDALMKSGRPILFCLCGGQNGNSKSYQSWSPVLGNYWRTTGDIGDNYASMISHIDPNSTSAYAAGPGRWNDPDMLEVGRGGMTAVQDQTHFTMWCIMAAPLIMGNNLTSMSAQTLTILTNAEAIAVDQDPAGEEGVKVVNNTSAIGTNEVWSKTLGYDFSTKAVVLFNRLGPDTNITVYWTNLGLQGGAATVRDLWAHSNLGTFTDSFTALVPSNSAMLLKVVGTPPVLPASGTNYLSDLQPVYAYTGFGTIVKDKSIGGNTMKLNGVSYSKGIGVNSRAGSDYDLGGVCSRFQATIGVDDEVGANGTLHFEVFADGQKVYDSGVMKGGNTAQFVDLDMTGVRRLILGIGDADDGTSNDHADWANALVIVTNTTPQVPHAPTGLTASPGAQVNLTWNTTLAATNYNIKRANVSHGTYTTIGASPVATFTDSGVTVGSTYYYVVSAVSSIGESTNSSELAVTACSQPAIPTNLVANPTGANIGLTWNAVPGATGYVIARAISSSPYTNLATVLGITNYTDTTAAAGVTYYYIVTASNACNVSLPSLYLPATMPPPAPTGLNATPGPNQVALSWNSSLGAVSYNVKRSQTNNGPYTTIAGQITSTTLLDTGVTNGTTYYYVVSAIDAGGGEGPNSAQVSAVPAFPAGTAYWTNLVTSSAQNWNANANWTNSGVFPNSVAGSALINANIGGNQTINLNQSITVGTLTIGDTDGSGSYTIAAGTGGTLNLNNGTNSCTLTDLSTGAGDKITAPINLFTNTFIAGNAANPLVIAGTMSGSGTMTVSGNVTIGDGSTNGTFDSGTVTDNGVLVFSRSDSVTVTNTITGTGSMKYAGTGTLTLTGSNSFSGPFSIGSGTVVSANASALGLASGGVTILPGGTLDVDANNLGSRTITVSGSGAGGKGAIYNSGGQQTQATQFITLAGDTTIGGTGPWNPSSNTGRWDIRANSSASLSTGGLPYNLTKTGSNQISLVGVTVDAALGNIDIQQGLMGFETSTTSMGNPAANLYVRAGATMSFFNSTALWNKNFQFYGDGITATVTNWSGSNTIVGPVTLNGTCIFAIASTGVAVTGPIGGPGILMKNLNSPLYLFGTNTYVASTFINGGTLALPNSGSLASTNINVSPGATFDVSSHTGIYTLGAGQTLGGFGTVKGNLNVGSGATLAPGYTISTMTFNNALALLGGSTNVLVVSKSPATNSQIVAGALTYGGTLVVSNISATPLAAGDSFRLFNAPSYSGSFSAINPPMPGSGLAWDSSGLTNGTLRVITAQSPHIGSARVSGGNLTISGSSGIPYASYYVLASTNAALPLIQWSRVATNAFDSNGNFTFMESVIPGMPRLFYLVRLP